MVFEVLLQKALDFVQTQIREYTKLHKDARFHTIPEYPEFVWKEAIIKWDIDEYSIMEEFCLSIKNEKLCDKLYYAIKGRGAFRRFKDEIIQYSIEEDWYKFRDEALKDIAIRWCNAKEIEYI